MNQLDAHMLKDVRQAIRLVIFLTMLFFSTIEKASSQSIGIADTLSYLRDIESKKSNFIGKPFSVLLDSLKLDIKYFSPFSGLSFDKYKETSTTFSFYLPNSADEMYLTHPCLRISWVSYSDAAQSDILFTIYGGSWNNNVKLFYANSIIRDIRINE